MRQFLRLLARPGRFNTCRAQWSRIASQANDRQVIQQSYLQGFQMDKRDFYRDARKDLTGPLHGLRVLEATTSWAGPMCGCVLADLGADVIKVEATDGEVGRRVRPFLTG